MRRLHHGLLAIMGAGAAMAAPACSNDPGPVERSAVQAQIERVASDEAERGHLAAAAALEDGVVTDAEFREAVVRAHQCMARAGLAVQGIERTPTLGAYDLGFSWEPGALEVDLAQVAADECEDEHTHGVRVAWAHQSGERLSTEARRLLASCFGSHGLPVDGMEAISDFRDAASSASRMDLFGTCLSEVAADLAAGT